MSSSHSMTTSIGPGGIAVPVLTATNYSAWAAAMRAALIELGLWHGTIVGIDTNTAAQTLHHQQSQYNNNSNNAIDTSMPDISGSGEWSGQIITEMETQRKLQACHLLRAAAPAHAALLITAGLGPDGMCARRMWDALRAAAESDQRMLKTRLEAKLATITGAPASSAILLLDAMSDICAQLADINAGEPIISTRNFAYLFLSKLPRGSASGSASASGSGSAYDRIGDLLGKCNDATITIPLLRNLVLAEEAACIASGMIKPFARSSPTTASVLSPTSSSPSIASAPSSASAPTLALASGSSSPSRQDAFLPTPKRSTFDMISSNVDSINSPKRRRYIGNDDNDGDDDKMHDGASPQSATSATLTHQRRSSNFNSMPRISTSRPSKNTTVLLQLSGDHLTPHRDWLTDYEPLIDTAYASTGIVGRGSLRLHLRTTDGSDKFTPTLLTNVLHVPSLAATSLSAERFCLDHGGAQMTTLYSGIRITHCNGDIMLIAHAKCGQLEVDHCEGLMAMEGVYPSPALQEMAHVTATTAATAATTAHQS